MYKKVQLLIYSHIRSFKKAICWVTKSLSGFCGCIRFEVFLVDKCGFAMIQSAVKCSSLQRKCVYRFQSNLAFGHILVNLDAFIFHFF